MRIYFYPNDYMTLTGKSERTAYTFMQTIKDALGKRPNQIITISEYCQYVGVNETEVRKALNIK